MTLAFQTIFFCLGIILSILAGTQIIPLAVDWFYDSPNWQSFLVSGGLTGFIGVGMVIGTYSEDDIDLKIKDTFFLTTILWVVMCLFASLPLYLSNLNLSFADSCFEAVSSLTTTGSTVINGLSYASKGILIWRALLQWLGGIGIVVMALIVFPTLRIGGMQLFRSESSDRTEKILPRMSQIASGLLGVYSLLTFLCFFSLFCAGVEPFDALCHAMCTVSTGGMSTHDESIGFFNAPSVMIILMIFMILGGVPLVLLVKSWYQGIGFFLRDSQVKAFLILLGISSAILSLWCYACSIYDLENSILNGAFHAVSILTSTGFSLTNYDSWGPFPSFFLLTLCLIGGCTGSTTGGIKIFRLQVLSILTKTHLKQLQKPHGVFVPIYDKKKISEQLINSILTFITLYVICIFILAALLSTFNLDFVTAVSGAIATLGNVGPALGPILGPDHTFGSLPEATKWILMFGMILGRLELLTIIVLFTPSFWKD